MNWRWAPPAGEPRPGRAALVVVSGAPEVRLAFLGEGVEIFELVAAVVSLPSQPLDTFVHLRRDGLVVGKDTELFLDDGHRHR